MNNIGVNQSVSFSYKDLRDSGAGAIVFLPRASHTNEFIALSSLSGLNVLTTSNFWNGVI